MYNSFAERPSTGLMISWHPSKFLFFFRPAIYYRFYKTGLAYTQAYLLPLSPALGVWKQLYLKAFTVRPWLRSWVTFLQTEVPSAPYGHIHCGTETSVYSIPWPFLNVTFRGLCPQPAVLGISCLKPGFTYLVPVIREWLPVAAPWDLSKMFENEGTRV